MEVHRKVAMAANDYAEVVHIMPDHINIIIHVVTQNMQKWQVLADLNDLSDEIQGVLKNHLSMFNVSSPSDVAKIDEYVKSLCVVYSFQPFAKQLPPEGASLKETLENCIKAAVGKWFRVLNAYLLPQVDKDAVHLAEFVSLSEHSLDLCQRALRVLNPIFLEAGVDYFSPFYIALDKSLCREAESRLAKHGVSTEISTFAIYRSFVGIQKMMKYVNKSKCEGLSILNFHKWLFKDMVNDWIRVAIAKCKDLISKAIAADTWITVSKDDVFSSSALDATGFLLQVGTFWKHLEWPVASEAYGYAVSVMQGISGCALFYISEVFKKISRDDMFDKKGQFRATEKVCIILNNMQHIRQELSQSEEKLELQSFCDWLEAEEKLGGPFKEIVKNVLASADEDIFKKMNQIMLEITDKLSPDIQAFLQNVIAKIGETIDEKVTDPLLEYLHHNLQTFVKYLSPAILKTILQHVWRVSLDSMDKCLVKSSTKKGTNATHLHQRLFTTLQTMRDFFHCEGDGLDNKELDSEKYKTLYSKLDILRLPTDKLNLRFFAELARCQSEEVKKGKAELGTLLISVAYLKQSSVLEVDVIQGKSLPRLDKRSVIDPFVQLSLMPAWAFSESSGKHTHFKTKVQKKTLDPFFNETFKLPAKQAEIDVEGTVLLLSVFGHEVVGANDFAGMCVVACKDIPQLVSSEALPSDPDAPQQKNLTLPLFRYTSETPAFAELDARVRQGDEKASNFFKVNKMLLGHLLRLRHSLPGLPKGFSGN